MRTKKNKKVCLKVGRMNVSVKKRFEAKIKGDNVNEHNVIVRDRHPRCLNI